MNDVPVNPIKSMHRHNSSRSKQVDRTLKTHKDEKEKRTAQYSYLHHGLQVLSAWIYLLGKQKPSANTEPFPVKQNNISQVSHLFAH